MKNNLAAPEKKPLQPSWLEELPATSKMAFPMVAGFFGQMLMGWADSIMVGKVGVTALAACAFANTVTMVFFVFGFGAMSCVSVCASRAFGAGKKKETGEIFYAGTVFAAVLSALLAGLILAGLPFYEKLGQPAELVQESRGFLVMLALSVFPALVLTSGKFFSEALSRPWMPFWVVIGSVALNVALNWVFIYGNLGSPALGLTGAGIATFLSRFAAAAVLFFLLFRGNFYRDYLPRSFDFQKVFGHFPSMARLGFPSAFQVLGEVGAFALASLMMGWFGVQALAAHQIAMTCSATTFMFPLGVSIAMSVRVGHAVGAGERCRVRPISLGGVALAAASMGGGALIFIFFGKEISLLFVDDAGVIALAVRLLVIASFFQICDGVQVVAVGCLRGMGDVRVPLIWTYFIYWGVALPMSWAMAFLFGAGPEGVWGGLATGLCIAAFLMGGRLRKKSAESSQNPESVR